MKIEQRHLHKSMSYISYRQLIDTLLLEGKTTGPVQSASLTEYAKLNVARMSRVDKTIELIPELKEVIKAIDYEQTWIAITEGWCGDAAQTIPLFNALSRLNDKIDLKLVLRDENPELMDKYLTNGKSRSIPKLIVTRSQDLEELFNWGPRPNVLLKLFYELKATDLAYTQIAEKLHAWYSKDKTVTTQRELLELFKNIR